METRQWNPRERQDNEFWLLQRLDDIMESANFHELPQAVVDKAMREHKVGDGVRVSHLQQAVIYWENHYCALGSDFCEFFSVAKPQI